jgi:hypothetical protein
MPPGAQCTASTNVWLWMLNESYSEELLVAPKLFYRVHNTGTGLMTDNLRSSSLLPLIEPYSGMANFTHTGAWRRNCTIIHFFIDWDRHQMAL